MARRVANKHPKPETLNPKPCTLNIKLDFLFRGGGEYGGGGGGGGLVFRVSVLFLIPCWGF